MEQLEEYVKVLRADAWPDGSSRSKSAANLPHGEGCSLGVYDLRMPFYRTVAEFLSTVVATATVTLDSLRDFAKSTHEILFAFDDSADRFVQEVFTKAVQLRSIGQRLEHLRATGKPFPEGLVESESELLMWFLGSSETWRQQVRRKLTIREDAI